MNKKEFEKYLDSLELNKKEYCIEAQNWNLVYAGKSKFPFNEIVGYKHTDLMDKEILK